MSKRKRKQALASLKRRKKVGKVFVGRIDRHDQTKVAKIEGFTPIKIHTSKEKWGVLSPYNLKTKSGYILENFWQFSKNYGKTRDVKLSLSRWKPEVITWERSCEVHMDPINNTPTEAYWKWRQDGFTNKYPVRYPNSYDGKRDVVCHIIRKRLSGEVIKLGYVEARIRIYCKAYWITVKKHPKFKELVRMHENGEDLLILDVDGPQYNQFGVPYCNVQQGVLGDEGVGTIEANEQNIIALLRNTDRPFGHGYTLATLIQNKKAWLGL
jgi:hypothetical protein